MSGSMIDIQKTHREFSHFGIGIWMDKSNTWISWAQTNQPINLSSNYTDMQ
jgi:hypothetical protein